MQVSLRGAQAGVSDAAVRWRCGGCWRSSILLLASWMSGSRSACWCGGLYPWS
ncbi:hypothetical protein [Kibdelosporangium philippinense]|uniref:hypothetical protein n=1 Tax=Kibdelosporangium philippinense TaxID=211113 RepID=UPI0036101055